MYKSALITGHTKGIGLATANLLQQNGLEVVGISRKSGHDLSEDYEEAKHFIIDKNPDIFINNAYVPQNQTNLLKDVYKAWETKDKLIINLCSVAALVPLDHPDYNMPYALDKRNQKRFCDDINFNYSKVNFTHTKCGLVNLNFDYVKTSFKSKHDKRLYPNLNPKEVADIIWYAIKSFQSNICFRELSFHSTKMPELLT